MWRCGVNFSEQPPSNQWVALKYRGKPLAEVWLKPEGEPCALAFRIPQKSFQIPGMGQRLTIENLLKAVGIGAEDVESWHHGDASHSGMNGSNPELRQPLPPPPQDVDDLGVYVCLKPPPRAVAREETDEPDAVQAKWQDLEARWKALLGLEATIDTLRMSLERVRAEMEASSKKMLTAEQKVHALSADVHEWNKAKTRVLYALPKLRDYISRAIWAAAAPERKELGELFKDHVPTNISPAEMDKVQQQLEGLQKSRQVLSAHGVTIQQECKSLSEGVQAALRTLQSNAAARARQNKDIPGKRGRIL
jgi:hypothetical protein